MGLVSPLEFISLAEENGTILKIGKHVLEEACRQLRYWQNQFSSDLNLSMSINVSPKQLLQKHLLSEFLEVFDKHKILPSQIKLEITESVVVENSEYVISILKQFRAIGVRLSMDDFGTGYSSLSYLHKLPINTLKIDRSFVSQMTLEAEGEEIVKTIILLAKALKLDIVAEGIETLEQHKMLGELGCDYGQGYYFSKPLEIEDATDYLKESFPTFYKLPLDGVSEMPKINF
jgi:EAL domain-containing protein (putative c-di-GMP-specific phosphodiesterase class I)